MKKKFILSIIICTLLTGCGRDPYIPDKDAILKENENKVEVFNKLNLYDLIGENNIKVLTKNKELDTNKVGTFKETIDYEFKEKKYKYDLTYNVIDVNSPFVISYQKSVTTLINNVPYPCESANYVDDYDDEPSCEIIGEYDITTPGEYKVQYRFYDSSNNETTKDLKIKILEELPPVVSKPSTPSKVVRTPFEDYINKYKKEDNMIGIDVSRWQGKIDFEKVKEAGAEFVIMRLGIQSNYDKDISVDSYYHENIVAAKQAGLKVGVYVYTTAINNELAKEHAKWTLEVLDGLELDFPIAYDWENWKYLKSYNVSMHTLSEAFNTFAREVNKGGYEAMLYSSKYYLENIWKNRLNYPVWLAHYTTKEKSSYEGDYILWQLSSTGSIPGISGSVDVDIYYNKKEDVNE